MANYIEDHAEPLNLTEAIEAEIFKSVTNAISGLAPDEVQAIKKVISKLNFSPSAEGEHPITKTLHAIGTGTVALPAEEVQAQLVRAVPKLGSLLSKVAAKWPDIAANVLAGLIVAYVARAVIPPTAGTTTIHHHHNPPIVISAPAPALSPLAQLVLDELRKIGGAVSREGVLAATSLSPPDIDRALGELVQAGVVIEAPLGVFTLR